MPETEKKTTEQFDLTSRWLKQCLSSRLNLKKIRKNFKFLTLNNEPDASLLPINTNFAFATHSTHNKYCAPLLDNAPPHILVLIEVTKNCVDVVNKMTSTTCVVPCLLPAFKHQFLGRSKFPLSGPLMEILKTAVNYNNSKNNPTDIGGASLRRLPQFCFTSQTRSIQTQTDLITNVTIERFIITLNGNKAIEFSKIIDIILSGYSLLEIDSNTLFDKFMMEKKIIF